MNALTLQILNKLDEIKKVLKELAVMKQHAQSVAKLQLDNQRLKEEISRIEEDLASSGSTRTADDVQGDLHALTDEMYVLYLRVCSPL